MIRLRLADYEPNFENSEAIQFRIHFAVLKDIPLLIKSN